MKVTVREHHNPVQGDTLQSAQAGQLMVGGKEVASAAVFLR